MMRNIIFNFINKYHGEWESIYKAIASKETNNNDNILAPENAIFISDENYLDKFKAMYLPPFAIFMSGNKKLLNKKIFGILGKINLDMMHDISTIHSNNYVICILEKNIDINSLKYYLDSGINFIVIKDSRIHNEYQHPGLLYISEFNTIEIRKSEAQNVERILYNLSDNVYIKSNIEKDAKMLFRNHKNSKRNCFLIIDTKITSTVQELIDQGVLKIIRNINDVLKIPSN